MRNQNIPAFPVYLFDIDGTLLDTAEDFCFAVLKVLSLRSRRDVASEFVRTYIGRPVRELFADVCPHETSTGVDAMIHDYRMIYTARDYPATRCYNGVAEVLGRLPGKKSTATTKASGTARAILERFDLARYFNHIQGTDSFPAKPNPEVIFKALEGLGARPLDCLFVGDSTTDSEAARNAGVRFCAVTYGYGDPAQLRACNPEYIIDWFRELLPGNC